MIVARSTREIGTDPKRIYEEAKMQFRSTKKITLVVEGLSDVRLFGKWVDPKLARVIEVSGKRRVLSVHACAAERGETFVAAIVDLDFDRLTGRVKLADLGDRIVYVDFAGKADMLSHDMETVLVRSKALDHLLLQEGLQNESDKIRQGLQSCGAEIGSIRAAGEEIYARTGRSPFRGEIVIPWELVFDANTIRIDSTQLLKSLVDPSLSLGDEVQRLAEKARGAAGNDWELCCGHDLTEMLALVIESRLRRLQRNRRISNIEIEKNLRLAFDRSMLASTAFGAWLERLRHESGSPLLI